MSTESHFVELVGRKVWEAGYLVCGEQLGVVSGLSLVVYYPQLELEIACSDRVGRADWVDCAE